MEKKVSLSPNGESFVIPTEKDYEKENLRLKELVEYQRGLGREIVVVMGVGFVGVVMAAIVADTEDEEGNITKFVIGMQRPSVRSYWKIPIINRGESPVEAEDPEVAPMIERCVKEKKNFVATFSYDALSHADVVVIDVQCDFTKTALNDVHKGHADIVALEKSLGVIGEYIPPKALVLIETTVPPGTTEHIAYPTLKRKFKDRGILEEPVLAHSYERVMPGKEYVASIRDFWRVCSGINEESRTRVEKFLNEVLNTDEFPLTVLDRPIESETAKIMENSFRASILAFVDEWSLFAERNGVDILKVIEAIKVRPTHNNLIFPGPGIGGYCLPKDGGLGVWAYKHILGFEDDIFKFTPEAININDSRALHAATLVRDALRNLGRPVPVSKILVLGASYREDVGDTRYSGSEVLIRRLSEMGAELSVHDPYVTHWWEFKNQSIPPASDHSKKQYFRNQDKLESIEIQKDLENAMDDVDCIVFAVRHNEYLDLDPDKVLTNIGKTAAIVDCFGILDDKKIKKYFKLGCEVKGLGRGHIQRIKDGVKKESR